MTQDKLSRVNGQPDGAIDFYYYYRILGLPPQITFGTPEHIDYILSRYIQ